MRPLSAYLIGFVLAVLLVGMTPFGTGTGSHQLELVHPLFSHLHMVDGRLMTHEQILQRQATAPSVEGTPTHAPALGSGGASALDSGSIGVSPALTLQPFMAVWLELRVGWATSDSPLPRGREEAPPVPPPLSA